MRVAAPINSIQDPLLIPYTSYTEDQALEMVAK